MAIISKRIIDLLQLRIKHEEFNSKVYTAMSNWLNLHAFEGASKLWKSYADDERGHKQWAVDYLLDLNILPIEPDEDEPQLEYKGLPNIIALSYQREIQTTKEVQELAKASLEEGDMLTFGLAQKYVAEQVEEIQKIQFWIDYLVSFGDSGTSLQLLDEKMGDLVE